MKKFFEQEKVYFSTSLKSVLEHNYSVLIKGLAVYAVVLAFYTILTLLTDQPKLLLYMYFAYDGIHAALIAAVMYRRKKRQMTRARIQVYCVLLQASILSFFALEGALTSIDQPALYVPIAALLIQMLMIQTSLISFIMNISYVALFATLSYLNKMPVAYINDFYIALATFISSLIGYYLISRTRQSEGAALRKYESLSKMDATSGVYNKITFEHECASRLSDGSEGYAFIVADIVGFKYINAKYGYEVGDGVLSRVGFAINKVFYGDVAGRFGGDEFVIMTQYADVERLKEKAELFTKQIAQTPFTQSDISVKCVCGIALAGDDDDIHALFIRAERAAQDAKASGETIVFARESFV